RPRRAPGPAGPAGHPGLALAATGATPAHSRQPQLEAAGAGSAVGLDALRPEHGPADRGLAAGQCRRWRTGDGRLRPGHLAGDAAADLDRRTPGALAAAPGTAQQPGDAGALCRRADPGRAVADAGAGVARPAGRTGLPPARRLSRLQSRTQSRPASLARYSAASAAAVHAWTTSSPGRS